MEKAFVSLSSTMFILQHVTMTHIADIQILQWDSNPDLAEVSRIPKL
jgi:hypothetical protein